MLFFCCADIQKEKEGGKKEKKKKSGGITQRVKVIIGINEVNLLLVCQCQYLELVEGGGENKKLNREKRAD